MDGRILTLLLTYVLPAALIVLTVWKFASNPLAILALVLVMIGGSVYLLTYTDSFGGPAAN
ncbi:MAG TPA: hypothetical protein VGP88_08775 [Thermoplasmata archaeon]|jgi:hypothetical protein|nr:hypothetical protein [Thermoplasmata archaeon]